MSPVDHTEAPPPPGKMTPPPTVLIQEEIGAEICQSKQTLAGLAEVPPPSHLYTGGSCSRVSPEHTGERPLPVHGLTQTLNMLAFFMLCFRCNHDNRPPFDLRHLHRRCSELWVNVTEAQWKGGGGQVTCRTDRLYLCRCLLWSAAVAAGASGLITTFACK